MLNSSGDYSCKRTLIQCPINNTCNINCVANPDEPYKESICKNLTINGTESTHVTVRASSNWDTLRGAKLYCPYRGQCELYGQGNHVMTFMDIYAIRGFRDINIECDECYLGKLYCTPQFNENCHIVAAQNECQKPCNSAPDHQQICDDYNYIYPSSTTSIPTSMPSSMPSISSTLQPSQSRSQSQSQSPATTTTQTSMYKQ